MSCTSFSWSIPSVLLRLKVQLPGREGISAIIHENGIGFYHHKYEGVAFGRPLERFPCNGLWGTVFNRPAGERSSPRRRGLRCRKSPPFGWGFLSALSLLLSKPNPLTLGVGLGFIFPCYPLVTECRGTCVHSTGKRSSLLRSVNITLNFSKMVPQGSAGGLRLHIRRLLANDAGAGELGAAGQTGLLPGSHPRTIAPAVGAE